MLGGDAGTRISDADPRLVVASARSQLDRASRRRMVQRVGHQVVDHLLETVRITENLIAGAVYVGTELDVPLLRFALVSIGDVPPDPFGPAHTAVERAASTFDER